LKYLFIGFDPFILLVSKSRLLHVAKNGESEIITVFIF